MTRANSASGNQSNHPCHERLKILLFLIIAVVDVCETRSKTVSALLANRKYSFYILGTMIFCFFMLRRGSKLALGKLYSG